MSCEAFEGRIARYVGGDPDAELEIHLRTCAECAELARQFEEDREWLASRPPEMADVDYAAMRSAIRQEIARPQREWKWVAAAAAIILAIGLASMVRRTPPPRVEYTAPSERAEARSTPPPPAQDGGRASARPAPPAAPVVHDPDVRIELATNNPEVTIILLPELKGDTQ